MRPGSQRVEITGQISGLTVSAFVERASGSLTVVGVKQGGSNKIQIAFSKGNSVPARFDLYLTTPSLNCSKQGSVAVENGVATIDLPDEAIFTLVGASPKG